MSLDSPENLHIDGSEIYVAIVASRFNDRLVSGMLERTVEELKAAGVQEEGIIIQRVPGANEIPYAANMLAISGQFDVIITLGVVIAGDTNHHDHIAHCTSQALQKVGMIWEVPVINGIITVKTEAQAEKRCIGEYDRGREFARAGLEMAVVKMQLAELIDDVGSELLPGDDEDFDDIFDKN